MHSNLMVNKKGEKTDLLKLVSYKKSRITVMLAITCNVQKFRPHVTLKRKTMLKGKLSPGIIFLVQEKDWMIEELVLDSLKILLHGNL